MYIFRYILQTDSLFETMETVEDNCIWLEDTRATITTVELLTKNKTKYKLY